MAVAAEAQVYSPKVLRKGQPDPTDLRQLATGIYSQAEARTPRERAEAIWRYFLTDGRFVKPGFWYHIAGWAYEEPMGEVLDPLKLINSYGFGLCYQIAPVLEAVYKAGGFEDARVWFLTGHTVAEVFYEGAYHYFDSDMMGYNPVGTGPVRERPVASVHQMEQDGGIMLSKLKGPKQADAAAVDDPWYPADVREDAIAGLAELFTTTSDNWLFPFERAPQAHSMSFQLRPGERLIRYYKPERAGDYYLPYKFNGREWKEFPQEIAEYRIRTEDGPRSQKDARLWGTGRFEYRPRMTGDAVQTVTVQSPYVIIDAAFDLDVAQASDRDTITVETSTDDGHTWTTAGRLRGPAEGQRHVEAALLTRSEHGRRTAVSGTYAYLARFTRSDSAQLRSALLTTSIQLNPRTLPELAAGRNELVYTAGPPDRHSTIAPLPTAVSNARYVDSNGQGFWVPAAEGPADFVFRLGAGDNAALRGIDAGGRFLDLSGGFAPDKFTAEIRSVAAAHPLQPAASMEWSPSPDGPFQRLWEYDSHLKWKDGIRIDRALLWPEVDRHATVSGARQVYVRYHIRDMAIDNFRLAVESEPPTGSSPLIVSHVWTENGVRKTASKQIPTGTAELSYTVNIPAGVDVGNEAIILECPAQ